MLTKLFSGALIAALLFFSGCTGDEKVPRPDVSGFDVPLTLLRFDKALRAVDTGAVAGALLSLDRQFGDFTQVYFTEIAPVRRRDFDPEEQQDVFRAYLNYPVLQRVDSLVKVRFPDEKLEPLVEDFRQSLRYYQYYLPGAPVPDTLVTFFSPFELAAFLYGNDDIAISLDFLLGPDFNYEAVNPQEPIFSDYLTRTYTPEHFTGRLLRVMLDELLPRPRSGRMIDYLVYEGKRLYLLERLMPEAEAHVVFEVSPDQMEWLRENEGPIYVHLQQEDALYTTDVQRIRRSTQPGPTSQGMPADSPGGAVNYLGYRIVEEYMKAKPGTSMTDLLAITDGQQLLAGARYKPR